MFVVYNVTSQRVSLKLLPSSAPEAGTPNWRMRRFARQNTFHAVVDPHQSMDLMSFGYTEKEVLEQPEVLEYLRLGYLRRVEDGGGYVEDQFNVLPVAAQPVAPTLPAPSMPPDELVEPKTDFATVEVVTKSEGLPVLSPVDIEEPKAEEPKEEAVKAVVEPPMPMARKPFIRPKNKR